MIAVVKDGAVERIVDSTTGLNMTGRTTQALPGDYDPVAGNYAFVGGAFVPNEAAALAAIRARRDVLIAASDFVEFSRRLNVEQKAEGLAWRDALFDLPETTDPFAPEWPTPPAWLNLPD